MLIIVGAVALTQIAQNMFQNVKTDPSGTVVVNYLNETPDNKFNKQFRIDNPNEKIWSGKFGWQILTRMMHYHNYKNIQMIH